MHRAHLILNQLVRGGLSHFDRRGRAGFVDGPKHELPAVRRIELERLRLHAAAGLGRLETPGVLLEIENRDANRRRPEIAVEIARKPSPEVAGSITRAGGDGDAVGPGPRNGQGAIG
jgi:hypothetical protein